jgi:hypothetical protein
MGYRITVALACVAVMTGCAGRAPTQPTSLATSPLPQTTVPQSYAPAPTTTTPTTSPAYGGTTPLGGLPGAVGTSAPGSLGYSTPGYGVQSDPLMGAGTLSAQPALTARITSKKNGVVFGIGKFKVSVSVSNTGTMAQSGTLKVAITDKGKTLQEFSEHVTIQPGQTLNRDFEDKRWKADDATVSVTTDADPMASGMMMM